MTLPFVAATGMGGAAFSRPGLARSVEVHEWLPRADISDAPPSDHDSLTSDPSERSRFDDAVSHEFG